jgi:hypothetical protein
MKTYYVIKFRISFHFFVVFGIQKYFKQIYVSEVNTNKDCLIDEIFVMQLRMPVLFINI